MSGAMENGASEARAKAYCECAIEKAKKHFEKLEDYEMCQTCVSLINKIKKSTN